jgi:TonB family protein
MFMIQKIISKSLIPLVVTAGLGLMTVWLIQPVKPPPAPSDEQTQVKTDAGNGATADCVSSSPCSTPRSGEVTVPTAYVTAPLKITARPKAQYTEEARTREVQGIVRLKVVLLADGQVGEVTPLSRLPFGLTEQAIEAAKQIKFEPRKINGIAQTSVVTLEYSFTIY